VGSINEGALGRTRSGPYPMEIGPENGIVDGGNCVCGSAQQFAIRNARPAVSLQWQSAARYLFVV